MTELTEILQGLRADGEASIASIPTDWQQGRTAFGGLTAAIAIAAAHRFDADLPPLRGAQFAFTGPVSGDVRAVPTTLRKGRSSAYISVDILGEGGMACRATLLFAAGRETSHRLLAGNMPGVPSPEGCPDFFGGPGAPAFTAHFEARLASGSALVSGADDPAFRVWVRHRGDGPTPPMTRLVAMGDALPPAVLALASAIAPVSTMSWSIDVALPDDLTDELDGEGWHLMESRSDAIADGYSTQVMTVWRPDGTRVLQGRQVVAAFF